MEAKLEQRLHSFLESTNVDRSSYEGDPDMSEKRIDIYVRWLNEIGSNMKELAKRLNERELSCLLDAVDMVYPEKYFVFGTHYGSGYGIRPVLEITRNILERGKNLWNEESKLVYVSALGKIYMQTKEYADPKYHYDGEGDRKNNSYVNEMNQKIDGNPSEIPGIISEFMRENFPEGGENE